MERQDLEMKDPGENKEERGCQRNVKEYFTLWVYTNRIWLLSTTNSG